MGEPQDLDALNSLTRALWGSPQAILKRDDRTGLECIDFSEHDMAATFLLGATLPDNKKILVREEYRSALQVLETDRTYKRGAYVTGQPGIGKSLFLAYILVIRLGRRQAIAWQICGRKDRYAMLRETASFHHEDDRSPLLGFPSLIWGLSDSYASAEHPLFLFYNLPGRVRTIQATSPKRFRYKEWSKNTMAQCYVMDIWSEGEIADLARLLELDVERMTGLAKKWGGVPRKLIACYDRSDERIVELYKDDVELHVTDSAGMLRGVQANAYPDDAPSSFYFCRPQIHPTLGVRRDASRAVVPTATLCTMLAEALRSLDSHIRLEFFRALAQCPGTRSAAGYIFENWFHSFLLASGTIECHWLQGPNNIPTLTGITSLAYTSWAKVQHAEQPFYWVAPTGFPEIDCALVLETGIYAIQVTLSSQHGSPIEGLKKLRPNLPQRFRKLPWSVLFVGDAASFAKEAAKSWVPAQGEIYFPPGSTPLSIGWAALDPVGPGHFWKPEEQGDEASMHVDE